MSLLLSMLPFYILGNLHCIGMCGPLVMLLGQHPFRYFYFLGRLLSFTMAGLIAGEIGFVFDIFFSYYHISAITSLLFGTLIFVVGMRTCLGGHYPGYAWIAKRLLGMNNWLAKLILRDKPWPTFLFGFFTIALPCGQTLIVFSACALSRDPLVGLINGMAFALLTSPSLLIAMHAFTLFKGLKKHYNKVMGVFAILIGTMALCRGFAEMDMIPHWTFQLSANSAYHIVIY